MLTFSLCPLRRCLAQVFGINLPWTLLCLRNYIIVPDTRRARIFCILFDSIVTKPFMRNHILLLQFSIQGFFNSEYFTLMLLDVVNISTTLQARTEPRPL